MPKSIVALIALLLLAPTDDAAITAAEGPTATVHTGSIRGTALAAGGVVFKGVPFAQPPVGSLRWREPQPVVNWQGVRDATSFGPPCAQSGQLRRELAATSKEDCLYLNVWAAEWPIGNRQLPVMVWIPGGGNFGGTSNLPDNDGERLARQGVVVVTINYRLSIFGFLAHPTLTKESPHHASGNYGLLDQIAALRWVQTNIGQFGGDRNNVTIFGESAGSFDVSFLMVSPLARGLFRRAIAESGSVTTLGDALTLAQAEKAGEALMARLNPAGDRPLDRLRELSVADIFKIEPPYLTSPPPALLAVVDGYTFTDQPSESFAKGREQRVPLIIGSAARERVPGSRLPTDLPGAIRSAYGPLAPRALSLYGVSDGSGAVHPRYGSPAEQWATDTSFRCSATLEASWHVAAGNATYQYEFDRVPRGREALGATHASELPYVFGVLSGGRVPAQYDATDESVSLTVQRYWTNFAKTGDPNGAGVTIWPKFDPQARRYLAFANEGPMAGEGLRREFCDLYIEHVKSAGNVPGIWVGGGMKEPASR